MRGWQKGRGKAGFGKGREGGDDGRYQIQNTYPLWHRPRKRGPRVSGGRCRLTDVGSPRRQPPWMSPDPPSACRLEAGVPWKVPHRIPLSTDLPPRPLPRWTPVRSHFQAVDNPMHKSMENPPSAGGGIRAGGTRPARLEPTSRDYGALTCQTTSMSETFLWLFGARSEIRPGAQGGGSSTGALQPPGICPRAPAYFAYRGVG